MKINTVKPLLPLAFLLSTYVATAGGAEWDVSGNIDLTTRSFIEEARWFGQGSEKTQLSIAGSAEFRWHSDGARASIIPVVRLDEVDDERSLIDLKEAYWAKEADDYELLIGVNTVFWGVTESVHLVDIINQTDAVADIDGEDKLGQPMINLELQRDWGRIGVYLLPYFRERTFPGLTGRLRAPLPVDTDNPIYESSREEQHVDLALRYSNFVGDVDFGISLFSGTNREPRLVANEATNALVPYYDQINQVGLDIQYTSDAWLWKLEAIGRETQHDSFAAVVGGFEYTFYQVAKSAADIGVLLEFQYDGRDESESVTLADNDIFSGVRFALNDTQDTALLAGVGYDLDTSEAFINIEADRRFGKNFVLEMRARFFTNSRPGDNSYVLGNDDYLQLKVSRYF